MLMFWCVTNKLTLFVLLLVNGNGLGVEVVKGRKGRRIRKVSTRSNIHHLTAKSSERRREGKNS